MGLGLAGLAVSLQGTLHNPSRPPLALMLWGRHLPTLNTFWKRGPYFSFAQNPANHVAGPACVQNEEMWLKAVTQ